MTEKSLEACIEKMRSFDMGESAIGQFTRLYQSWQTDESEWIRESDVEPLQGIKHIGDIHETINHRVASRALSKTAMLKLNGGLGTSMGLQGPKSLLPVRRHKARQMNFLDIILGQVTTVRQQQGVKLPLTFMNSYRTSKDSITRIRRNRNFHQDEIPLEILQNREPKIEMSTGLPVSYPSNPDLEWCPPGHGDVFTALWESGLLDILQAEGMEYLFISNSDNLGARPSSTVSGAFAQSGATFMVEVARKTDADRKGGQIVRNKKTGCLMLREMTQVHPDDKDQATDVKVHPYFNTNNIWVRISALKKMLKKRKGVLPLPVIRNMKTVNPTDSSTKSVIQLETAMGAAISLFEDAVCVEVSRSRFLPVKTTNDLLILRSDRFHLTDAFEMEDGNYIFPDVNLDTRFYKNIEDFDERFPYSVPSLAAANSLTIEGDWTFGKDVHCFADAHLSDMGRPSYVPNGSFVGSQGIEPDSWQ
ncbi:UTP--glucose-1-phosphate uridylyltransferase [Scardovia inopinata]|uniref:UTP--glucose-1-phosphate uridylyltransferase n=1 Tax=Scardovia inopinata F0304 TaxID=641146 RepID=W5IJH5_SCAIO|nr:UTP--glucose-1-phosphate uridylyltransferase [Scardovia inopinata]EFG27154.1 hypothetical protein HMPREF9020_00793 [Scardovia inopinata F0304]BAR06766.1 UTP-glucose-1-phosphate uridylyltransferase [Scardovia inopinata JCM 12537]SUV50829.1 UTP--glucose-1-phosphate uridylyltransferase [Scardovia inopinata]